VKHVKIHLNRFLRRVRIHGGEFDTSARAMYREGVTSSLRAELRIVRGSTIERKQMSTKTTFKRIALVAVASLGLGVLASAPSNATASATDFSVSSATASQLTSETATATSVVATLSFGNTALTDTITVTASLFSAKNADGTTMTSGLAQPSLDISETSAAQVQVTLGTNLAKASAGGEAIANDTPAIVVPTDTTKVAVAKFRVFLNGPTKAGTYVVRLTPAVGAGGTAASLQAATFKEVTITVTQNAATDTVAASATSLISKGETTTAVEDAVVTHTKKASTTVAAATIKVSLLNAAGKATTGESYTATISGSGTLGSGAQDANGGDITASGRALTVKAGDVVRVFPDGTSGVATVTIGSAAGVILATEKVTFYGDAATVTATVEKSVIAPTAGVADALLVVVKDASGTEIQDATLYVTSSDATIIANTYAASCGAYSADDAGYLCSLDGVKAGTANITVGTKASATATTGVNAAAVSVRVGSTTPATVSVTTDKATYIPGEKAKITVVLKDKDGLVLADGTYTNIFATGGIEANYTLGTGSDTTTASSVDGFASGVKTFSVYMPIAETDVKFSWTTGTTTAAAGTGLPLAAQDKDGSVTVTVASSSGTAAMAAAEEATAAANDATDAALSAAEAAEAATAMAQEAVDAVAELSASVTKLISALRAQITTLTNLVVKIQKKVRA
jgi:trimeric autotransporter adhesin